MAGLGVKVGRFGGLNLCLPPIASAPFFKAPKWESDQEHAQEGQLCYQMDLSSFVNSFGVVWHIQGLALTSFGTILGTDSDQDFSLQLPRLSKPSSEARLTFPITLEVNLIHCYMIVWHHFWDRVGQCVGDLWGHVWDHFGCQFLSILRGCGTQRGPH